MATGIFWAAAAIITLIVAVMLIFALRRGQTVLQQSASFDRQVYRDQLQEIERDLARMVIVPEEADRLRAEVGRRLLEADRADTGEQAANTGPQSAFVIGLIALTLAAGFAIYTQLGKPGEIDQPLNARLQLAEERRMQRPSQAEIEAQLPPQPALTDIAPEFAELVTKLRDAVAKRPDDLQGQTLLARNEANLGNFAAAYQAQSRVIALKGDTATQDDKLMLATLMIQAAGGQVSPEAEAIFNTVLMRTPDNDTALFFSGIVNMQVGRIDLAFLYWQKLMAVAPADSRWRPEVAPRMAELAEIAGVRYDAPEGAAAPTTDNALRGPSAEDMKAAADLTPEERQAMIRTMVEGLNDRLASEGGTAEEWARLIVALANLGEADRAKAIWAEAQKVFAGRDAEMATVLVAAQTAGVAP